MIILRAARQTDAGAVGAILSEFIDTTPWMPRVHTRAEDLSFAGMMIDRGWVTVAEVGGAVRGFAACDGPEVNALYVARAARNQRIGTRLLQHLKAQAPALTLWTFQANRRAQQFYARHGFAEVARSDGAGNDEKLPDVRLAWQREAA